MGKINEEIFDKAQKYLAEYADHRQSMREWTEFRHGKQWKKEDKEKLDEIGHAPVVINLMDVGVEQSVSFLTFRNPRYSVVGRMDSDTKIGRAFSNFLSYIWYISRGDYQYRRVVTDHSERGQGLFYVYADDDATYGEGELKFMSISPFNVLPDTLSVDPFYDDADEIIYFRDLTEREFKNMLPEKNTKKLWMEGCRDKLNAVPNSTMVYDSNVHVPEGDLVWIGERIDTEREQPTIIEHFSKIRIKKFRVYNQSFNTTHIFDEKKYKNYLNQVVPVMELFKEDGSRSLIEIPGIPEVINMTVQRMQEQGANFRVLDAPREALRVQGMIKESKFSGWEIEKICQLGKQQIYKETLPIQQYPIIPAVNLHEGSFRCKSDVAKATNPQIYLNKFYSLMLAYAQAATGVRILVPKGTFGGKLNEFNENILRPVFVQEYDPSLGAPHAFQLPALPNELFNIVAQMKHMVEYSFGIFEGMMGNSEALPETYRTTVASDEYGQRRMKSKTKQIEESLNRLGNLILEWSTTYYTGEKMFRVLDPHGGPGASDIGSINFDDYANTITAMSDPTTAFLDAAVESGSSLPVNKLAEYEMYRQALIDGAIDQEEFLKKTEIFDKEGVLQRTSMLRQMQQQLQMAGEKIQELEGSIKRMTNDAIKQGINMEINDFDVKLEKILVQLKAETAQVATEIGAEMREALTSLETKLKLKEASDTQKQSVKE